MNNYGIPFTDGQSGTMNSMMQWGINPNQTNGPGILDMAGISPQAGLDSVLSPTGGNPVIPDQGSSWWDSAFGNSKTGAGGWVPSAIAGATGIFNGWLGMKQYGLARNQFKESKRQFNLNFDAQKKLTNSQLEAQHSALIASAGSGGSKYRSVGEHMNKYGVA